jgi:hypothetical protein
VNRRRDTAKETTPARPWPASLAPLGLSLCLSPPLQRQRASDSTAPVLPALVTCGCGPRFGPSPSPQGFSPVATIKGGQAEGEKPPPRGQSYCTSQTGVGCAVPVHACIKGRKESRRRLRRRNLPRAERARVATPIIGTKCAQKRKDLKHFGTFF